MDAKNRARAAGLHRKSVSYWKRLRGRRIGARAVCLMPKTLETRGLIFIDDGANVVKPSAPAYPVRITSSTLKSQCLSDTDIFHGPREQGKLGECNASDDGVVVQGEALVVIKALGKVDNAHSRVLET